MYDSRDSAVNQAVQRACRGAGFAPRREHDAPGTAVLLSLVSAGLGIAVVPASVRSLPLEGLVMRDLADGGTIELALAQRRHSEDSVATAVAGVIEAALAAPSRARETAGDWATGER